MSYESTSNVDYIIESCKPAKKRGRSSYKRQLQEMRDDHKLNLQSAESIIASTNLRSVLSVEAFNSLPESCRRQLMKLLPEIDQIKTQDGCLRANESSINNEHFIKFCEQYAERLSENKLRPEAIEERKNEATRELCKLDPWKLKNYEPVWGHKLISHSTHDLNSAGFESLVRNTFSNKNPQGNT